MRVISHTRLVKFWENPKSPAGSQSHLAAWEKVLIAAEWHNFAELRATFGSADAVGDCVVFDVWNNNLRVISRLRYEAADFTGRVYILKVMDHAEYSKDKWPDECGCHTPPPKPKGRPAARPVKKPRKKK